MSTSSNSNNYSSVVIAGASGNLGNQIVKAFLNQPNVRTHILVRNESKHKVEELIKLGAHIIEGDVTTSSVEELAQSFKGIEVIVSALSGDHSVVYDGQLKLLNAAKLSGVKKFVPSSYGFNFQDYLQLGDSFLIDPKKKLISDLQSQNQVDYLLIHNGLFYSYAFFPGFLFQKENDTIKYYGDLNVKIQLTDTLDIAKYVVEASLNPQLKNKSINVAGDEKTLEELAHLSFPQTQLKFEKLGSAQDLKNLIQKEIQQGLKPEQIGPIIYQQLQWITISGVAHPPKTDNDLFNVKPQ